MAISKPRLKEIKTIREEDIDYSDIPELGDDFFRQAEVWMPPDKRARDKADGLRSNFCRASLTHICG